MLHNRRPLLLAALTACTTVATVDRPPVADPDASDPAATESDDTTDSDAGDPLAHCLPRRTRDRVTGAPWVYSPSGGHSSAPNEVLFYHPRGGDRVQGAFVWPNPRAPSYDLDYPTYPSGLVGLDGIQGPAVLAASFHLLRSPKSRTLGAENRVDDTQHWLDVRNGLVMIDRHGRVIPGGWWHDEPLPIDVDVCRTSDRRPDPPIFTCDAHALVVDGPVRDLTAWCAIRGDGSLLCQCELEGDVDYSGRSCPEMPWAIAVDDPGPWVELTQAGTAPYPTAPICALACDGTVACWGSNASAIEQSLAATPVRELLIAHGYAWFLDAQGQIGCAPFVDEPDEGTRRTCSNRPDGQGFSHLSFNGDSTPMCALGTQGSVHCWTESEGGLRPTLETGFVALSRGCALREDGTLACWGHGGLADTHPTREP